MALLPHIVNPRSISPAQIKKMISLMEICYDNVQSATFKDDLMSKDHVILLLNDGNNELCGFSTVLFREHDCCQKTLTIVFSGDTVIHPEHWGSMVLPHELGKLVYNRYCKEPNKAFYWLLTTKGYRTYRYLPLFFKRFYPSFKYKTPSWEKAVMDSLGQELYAERYQKETGLIIAQPGSQSLKPDYGIVDDLKLAGNPDIEYFFSANKEWQLGNELLCTAKFHPDNLSPLILRYLKNQRQYRSL